MSVNLFVLSVKIAVDIDRWMKMTDFQKEDYFHLNIGQRFQSKTCERNESYIKTIRNKPELKTIKTLVLNV